jgi:alpha-galactosidase/6-phospho-beta-glucosidase family protein
MVWFLSEMTLFYGNKTIFYMEEIEVPTEHLHETILEKAEEALKETKGVSWSMYVAISTALMAVFAAISGLMAGHHSNEALIDQIKASDQWAYYQAKGIKAEIKSLQVNAAIASPGDVAKYKKEQEEIRKQAEEAETSSKQHLEKHVNLAKAVTLFQIAIAISAISMLTRKKFLWVVSLAITLVGLFFFATGGFY